MAMKEPKTTLKTIYGPGGRTAEVEIGDGYYPPAGWSLNAPDKPRDPGVAENRAELLRMRKVAIKESEINDNITKNLTKIAAYQKQYDKLAENTSPTKEQAQTMVNLKANIDNHQGVVDRSRNTLSKLRNGVLGPDEVKFINSAPQVTAKDGPPAGFILDPNGRTINGKPAYISKDGTKVWAQ